MKIDARTIAIVFLGGLAVAGATAAPKGTFGQEEDRQFGRWTLRHTGLEGGTVFDVAYRPGDGDVAFAGTVLGVFRSLDGGLTWQASRAGLDIQTGGDGIAFNPQNPLEMFIGTLAGPFTSRDGGTTWLPINAGEGGRTVDGIVIDPNDPDHLIGIGPQNPPAYLESMDRGLTWTTRSIPVFGERGGTQAFLFDPNNSDIVYAGVKSFGQDVEGVARSRDGGQTWTLINTGLVSNDEIVGVVDLAVDFAEPTRLYAAGDCAGVYRSEDSGDSWVSVHDISCDPDVDVDPANPNRVVASSGVSFDAGDTWQASLPGGRFGEAVAIRPGSTTDLLAGIVDAGTFVSADNGQSWDVARAGLGAGAAMDIAFVDADTAFVAASQTGIFRTVDRGRRWTPVPSPVDLDLFAIAFATDPRFGYAGSDDGVIRSRDGGATWALANLGMEKQDVVDLAIDPTDPERVFAAVDQFNSSDLWRSVDGGDSWTPTGIPFQGSGRAVLAVVIDPTAPGVVYAGISDRGQTPSRMVYRSTDGGDSWAATDAAIDAENGFGVTALAIDPSAPETLYAGTEGSLFRTRDGGATWIPVPGAPERVGFISIDQQNPARIFASGWLTENGGATWARVGPNFPGGDNGTFVPGDEQVLFVTGFRGVFERRLFEARERLDFDLRSDDRFGAAVVATEEFAFIGLPGSDARGPDGGLVVVYQRTDDGYVEVQQLAPPPGRNTVNFGAAMDVHGDVLVIGAPDPTGVVAKGPAGLAAAIFERLEAGWAFKSELAPIGGTAGDEFGASIALSGDQIVVGAPGDRGDAGAAYLFDFQGAVVGAQQRIDPPAGGAGRFGKAVATVPGLVAVGRPGSPLNDALAGSVSLFQLVAGNLAAAGAVTPDTRSAGDEFGASVRLAGDVLYIGAPGANGNEGRTFRFDAVSRQQQQILASLTPAPGSRFGASIAVSGERVVVGAPSQPTPAGRLGTASVFEMVGLENQLLDTVLPDEQLFEFGAAVGLAGGNVIVGAPATENSQGAALALIERDAIFGDGFERDAPVRRKLHRFANRPARAWRHRLEDRNDARSRDDPAFLASDESYVSEGDRYLAGFSRVWEHRP